MSSAFRNTPPHSPWVEISGRRDTGYLSVYYSDDLSGLPIRFVTKPHDNKSDPNIETLTYGLFSTCSPSMRAGVVARGAGYVFFVTRRGTARVLAGYYRLRWYAPANSGRKDDVYLAAENARFIEEPPTLAEIDRACGTNINRRFRCTLLLSPPDCQALKQYLDRFSNALPKYIAEIDRLERFSVRHSGFRYPSWGRRDKFDWPAAAMHLKQAANKRRVTVNESPTGLWKCAQCGFTVKNRALLRQCGGCGCIDRYRPK